MVKMLWSHSLLSFFHAIYFWVNGVIAWRKRLTNHSELPIKIADKYCGQLAENIYCSPEVYQKWL
jgi:hypothetical protein